MASPKNILLVSLFLFIATEGALAQVNLGAQPPPPQPVRAADDESGLVLGVLFPFGFTVSYSFGPNWEIAYKRIEGGLYDFETFNLFDDYSTLLEQKNISSVAFDLTPVELISIHIKFSSGFYLSAGVFSQDRHPITIRLEPKTRTIGSNTYPNSDVTVKIRNMPKGKLIFGIGQNWMLSNSLGVLLSLDSNLAGRDVDVEHIEIISTPTLSDADEAGFKSKIVEDFRSRLFYRILLGLTYKF